MKINPATTSPKATHGAVLGTRWKSAFSFPAFNFVPQAEQKFSCPATSFPHWGQAVGLGADKETPQAAQKPASGKFSLPQDGQIDFSITGFN
jgi:hypothetical protein